MVDENLIKGRAFLESAATVWRQLNTPQLYEHILKKEEAKLSKNGSLVTTTGKHTGRSAQDKFIVENEETKRLVWWEKNKPLSQECFDTLYKDVAAYLTGKDLYQQDLYAGAKENQRVRVRILTQYAWHSLFIRHLLITPSQAESLCESTPDFLIVDAPHFHADPSRHGSRSETLIACDFVRRVVIIVGTSYAGEIKKSVFSFLNYHLPKNDIFPMHCSVNVGKNNDPAIFFGLSGTGKTTLSADPSRTLIGDDEHGWSKEGLFNFEGGCYAKMIRLSQKSEPDVYEATRRFGCVLENVVMDEKTRNIDLDDDSLTENTRGAYPISFIRNASKESHTTQPKNVILLTADAFGVMPPVARLTPEQAVYHFLSGYTARVAGTEKGVTEPEATFSMCFGAPFMSHKPSVYGDMFKKFTSEHKVRLWLVNTGWHGGPYGVGERISIDATRKILNFIFAMDRELAEEDYQRDPYFGFLVPRAVPGVESRILEPRNLWKNKEEYDQKIERLVSLFQKNFETFKDTVSQDVINAGPHLL